MPLIESITTAHNHWQYEPTTKSLPRDVYREIPALNASSIVEGIRDEMNPDPSAVKMAFEKGYTRPRTQDAKDSLDRGTLAHLFILEPHKVASEVAVWHGKTRKGAEWDAFEQENLGKLMVRYVDFEQVKAGCEVISKNPTVRKLLDGCSNELAVLGKHNSLFTKSLLDAATHRKSPRIPDLKTTERGISDHAVETTIRSMHYREKMACYRHWYADAIAERPERIEVVLIFAKTTPPYGINIRKLTDDGLDWAWSRCCQVMDSVEKCIQEDNWPVWFSHGATGLSSWEVRDAVEQMMGADRE